MNFLDEEGIRQSARAKIKNRKPKLLLKKLWAKATQPWNWDDKPPKVNRRKNPETGVIKGADENGH